MKIGDWIVYPMELRVQKASVPFAMRTTESPASLEAVRERNRQQDAAFERMLEWPEIWFLTAQHIANGWTTHSPLSTADDPEWYLKVRDTMYRRANAR